MKSAKTIGVYQLGNSIGKGAFSCVYLGVNIKTAQNVAIKQIALSNVSEGQLSKIQQEINLLKALNDPGIVKYIDSISTENYLNIILEYCENGSLYNYIKKFGPFPESLVSMYIYQALKGLCYLHSQGIIHRDIKGANILTTKDGVVKLADFGVAIVLNETEKPNSFAGTPYWMAPEIVGMNGNVSSKCDIWSLGCTVIELITGGPPNYRLNQWDALIRIVQDSKPPLPEQISSELKDFLNKCFVKDPNTRWSGRQLLDHPWIINLDKSTIQALVSSPTPQPPQVASTINQFIHGANQAQFTHIPEEGKEKQISRVHSGKGSHSGQIKLTPGHKKHKTTHDQEDLNSENRVKVSMKSPPSYRESKVLIHPDVKAEKDILEESKGELPPKKKKKNIANTTTGNNIIYGGKQGQGILGPPRSRNTKEVSTADSASRNPRQVYKSSQYALNYSSKLENSHFQSVHSNRPDQHGALSPQRQNENSSPEMGGIDETEDGQPIADIPHTSNSNIHSYSGSISSGGEEHKGGKSGGYVNQFDISEDDNSLRSLEEGLESPTRGGTLNMETIINQRHEGLSSNIKSQHHPKKYEGGENIIINYPQQLNSPNQFETLITKFMALQPQISLKEDIYAMSLLAAINEMIKDNPGIARIVKKTCGFIPFIHLLENSTNLNFIHAILQLLNEMLNNNPNLMESACVAGILWPIISLAGPKSPRAVRFEVAYFLGILIQYSPNSLMILIASGGLKAILNFMDLKLEDKELKDFAVFAVEFLHYIFELQIISLTDLTSILAKNGAIERLAYVLDTLVTQGGELVYIQKAMDLLIYFSATTNHYTKLKIVNESVIAVLTTIVENYPLPLTILLTFSRLFKNLASDYSLLNILENLGMIGTLLKLLSLLALNLDISLEGEEMSKELLKSLLYMCRLNAGRCEQAALKSVIPILLKLNTKYPNCKNRIVALICSIMISSRIAIECLWNAGGVSVFLNLLDISSEYLNAKILDTLANWLIQDRHNVERALNQESSIILLVDILSQTRDCYLSIISTFNKITRISPVIARTLFKHKPFISELSLRLTIEKKNRFNSRITSPEIVKEVLEIFLNMYQRDPQPQKLINQHQIHDQLFGIYKMVKSKGLVILEAIITKLLLYFPKKEYQRLIPI